MTHKHDIESIRKDIIDEFKLARQETKFEIGALRTEICKKIELSHKETEVNFHRKLLLGVTLNAATMGLLLALFSYLDLFV